MFQPSTPARGARAVIYARYSTDKQNPTSIDDQVASCRRLCERHGWQVVEIYADRAVSGRTAQRADYQRMVKDLDRDTFDVLVTDAFDRIGRNLAESARLLNRLSFHRKQLYTAESGTAVDPIMGGFLGTMAQAYIDSVSHKTRSSQARRVEAGQLAGGLGYGYRVAEGEAGQRTIVEEEAFIVRRIFSEYVEGRSPRAIAAQLNREGIPGPGGRPWGDTTIRGQVVRGTGLLNNLAYIGKITWNRCSYVKDPETGQRTARPHPPEEWKVVEAPDLRIVDDELWERAKARQKEVKTVMARDADGNALNRAHRRVHPLSGLLVCGVCGGHYVTVDRHNYGCGQARSKGICTNAGLVNRREVERDIVQAVSKSLMRLPDIEGCIATLRERMRKQRAGAGKERSALNRQIGQAKRELDNLVSLVAQGRAPKSILERIEETEERKARLEAQREELEASLAADEAALPSPEEIHRNFVLATQDLWRWIDPRRKHPTRAALPGEVWC